MPPAKGLRAQSHHKVATNGGNNMDRGIAAAEREASPENEIKEENKKRMMQCENKIKHQEKKR